MLNGWLHIFLIFAIFLALGMIGAKLEASKNPETKKLGDLIARLAWAWMLGNMIYLVYFTQDGASARHMIRDINEFAPRR